MDALYEPTASQRYKYVYKNAPLIESVARNKKKCNGVVEATRVRDRALFGGGGCGATLIGIAIGESLYTALPLYDTDM